jgi:hypothetical protein
MSQAVTPARPCMASAFRRAVFRPAASNALDPRRTVRQRFGTLACLPVCRRTVDVFSPRKPA